MAVCLALSTSLTEIMSLFLCGVLPEMVNKVLDFHADGVQPGGANIVIKFEDSLKRLRFREISLNKIHEVCVWIR